MRIAYLCADFGIPVLGYKGASVHVREVVRALLDEGHDVLALCAKKGEGNEFPAGASLVEIPPVKRLWDRSTVGRELEELLYNSDLEERSREIVVGFRPDVIYERYSLFGYAGLEIARTLGVPHLLEVNAPLRLERARTKGVALDRTAGEIEAHVFGGSDGVFAVSKPLQEYLLGRGAAVDRCFVLPNGVDTARFNPERRSRSVPGSVRERHGIRGDAIVVGFAGSLKPWHGTDLLLGAFAELRKTRPSVQLLIVGEGPEEKALQAQAKALGLDGAAVFTGRVDHEQMPAYLAALDVAVAPYRDVSDFYFSPLKLYEYMASGLAVIASDAGEIKDLVRDGDTGLLFPPGDESLLEAALSRLVDDERARARLGRAARVEAERHGWTNNARAIVERAHLIH